MTARLATWLVAAVFGFATAGVPAEQPVSLDELLRQVQQGRAGDEAENAKRIQAFKNARDRQLQLLEKLKQARQVEEARSMELEKSFEENEIRIAQLDDQLVEHLGSLKELYGVLQQVAGDARGQFENSLTNIQYPDRGAFLSELAQKMGRSSRMASLEEIERLWFELQREMTESGKVVRFDSEVVTADGKKMTRPVVRVGVFNVVSDGKYLEYVTETGRLVELARQPQSRHLARVGDLEAAVTGLVGFGLDPSRGQLLSLLVQTPSVAERIEQGGVIGYIIIGLGIIALLIALERLWVLMREQRRVRRQAQQPTAAQDNALGRVLKVYLDNPGADVETLELKLGEAVLKETPRFNRMLLLLKIIAVVAPLLGLLGTVTGMIITFQAITLFGAGDPRLMAGGISQALVTTVLGLCVAIPTILLHTLVSGRASGLTQVLEEQAAGMIAAQAERRAAGGAGDAPGGS